MSTQIETFAHRLGQREAIMGTFLKTPSPIICEVLGLSPLDVICLDAEHAPFGRLDTDACISQLRHADLPSLVRVAEDSATEIRNALDAGATGLLVPHVTSAQQAKQIVKLAHFGEGGRGFAGSTRAAHFTTRKMPDHIRHSAIETTIVLQIEDLAALEQVDEIAAVEGVHALFIGRADLAVAMGCGVNDEQVITAVKDICSICNQYNRAVGMFTPNVDEIDMWRELGASFFLLSSDHAFLLQGARALKEILKT